MGSLNLTPIRAGGGQTVTVEARNRPDILLTQTVNVTLSQVGVGGAIHVRARFNAISDTELQVTVPPVGPAFNGTEIIPASYRLFVQLPGRIEETAVPLQVLASAPAPSPTPVSTPVTTTVVAPPTPAPSPSSPIATTAIPIPGGGMHVVTSSGPVRVQLGAARHIALGSIATSGGTSSTSSVTGKSCGCHSHHCCCPPPCCCSCCCHNDADSRTPGGQPQTHIPPRTQPPRVAPPAVQTPGASTSSPPPGAGISTTPPGSGTLPNTVEAEMKVRWLVESSSPIRKGRAPDIIETSTDSELFSDTMSGTTSNGGQISIEPLIDPSGAPDPDYPPIKDFNFIISSQVLSPENQIISGQKITFRFIDPQDIGGDTSEIVEVSNDLNALKQKLETGGTPSGAEFAYADAEGKAYAWVRIRLFDNLDVPDIALRLKGVKCVVGEVVQPPAPVGLHSMVRPTPQTLTTSARLQQQQNSLLDMLVDAGEHAVESFGEWINGQLEAVAGLPRTVEQVLGFALKRIADGIILMFPMPGYSAAMLAGYTDELRATVIGLLLGIPRGIYAMGRDTIQDLQMILIDLPKALFNFFAEDPKFAAQIVGSIASTTLGQVFYELDPEFRDKINKAFSKFKGFMEKAGEIIGTLWTALRDQITFAGVTSALGSYLYQDFEKMVGGIGTDYLLYAKDGGEYRHFIGGFIAGDVSGYIAVTVGVELLLAWFTAGAGNVVSVFSKLGRLGAAAGQVIRLFQRFLQFIRGIQDTVGELVGTVFRTAKNGVGTIFLAIIRMINAILHPLGEHLIMPLLRAILDLSAEIQKKVVRMFAQFSLPPDLNGAKLERLAFSLVDSIPSNPTRPLKDVIQDTLEVLADIADETPGVARFDFQCL